MVQAIAANFPFQTSLLASQKRLSEPESPGKCSAPTVSIRRSEFQSCMVTNVSEKLVGGASVMHVWIQSGYTIACPQELTDVSNVTGKNFAIEPILTFNQQNYG